MSPRFSMPTTKTCQYHSRAWVGHTDPDHARARFYPIIPPGESVIPSEREARARMVNHYHSCDAIGRRVLDWSSLGLGDQKSEVTLCTYPRFRQARRPPRFAWRNAGGRKACLTARARVREA